MSALHRRLMLAGIVAAGLALRLWGIRFGAGQPIARPDEQLFALEALGMFSRAYGNLRGGWPGGFYTLFHAVLRGERLFYGDANLACLLGVNPIAVYLPMRAVSAVLGAVTALPVYALARTLHSERAGLCAAAIWAANYLVIRDGHFAVSDAVLCFAIALCLWACARGAMEAAFAVAGAAFAVKYTAAILAVPCGLAALARLREGASARRAFAIPVAIGLAAFLAVSPSVLVQPGNFFHGLFGHGARYGRPNGLIWYGLTVLPSAFGWIGLALGVAGLWMSRAPGARPVKVYALVFFVLVLAPLALSHVRYASPLVPVLAAGAGVALASIRGAAGWVALALALGPPAVRAAQFDRVLAAGDTRDLAARWLIDRGEPCESYGGWAHVHALERTAQAACAAVLPEHLRAPVPTLAGDSRPWSALVAQGPAGWEALGDALVQRSVDRAPAPGARVVAEARPAWSEDFVNRAPPLDARCWPQIAAFGPGSAGEAHDISDAFYVPFTGLAAVQRSGPDIVMRQRACGESGTAATR